MNVIVDDIGKVVERVRKNAFTDVFSDEFRNVLPLYLYGHRAEIAARLTQRDGDKVKKYSKYPLIALRLDTEEEKVGIQTNFSLNIAIINITDKKYNAEERYANVFKPILYPLYELFLKELKNSGLFYWEGKQRTPSHKKVDRPFYGTPDPEINIKNLFNDPVDAIEILNLKLSQQTKC